MKLKKEDSFSIRKIFKEDEEAKKGIGLILLYSFGGAFIAVTFFTAIFDSHDKFGKSMIFDILVISSLIGVLFGLNFCKYDRHHNPFYYSYAFHIIRAILRAVSIIDLYMWISHYKSSNLEYIYFIAAAVMFIHSILESDREQKDEEKRQQNEKREGAIQFFIDHSIRFNNANEYETIINKIKILSYISQNTTDNLKTIDINMLPVDDISIDNRDAIYYLNSALDTQINMIFTDSEEKKN